VRDATASQRLASLGEVSTAGELAAAREDPATGRVLPVRADIADMLPLGGLSRGSTVAVHGSVALVMALLAEATARGAWAAVVGAPDWGFVAAAELGVALERLAVIPAPGEHLASVIAALIDGMDLVVVGNPEALDASRVRRVMARARQRGTVLLSHGAWPKVDLELRYLSGRWHGMGAGHGYLRRRDMVVEVRGRGAAARSRRVRVVLPTLDPVPAPIPDAAGSGGARGARA